MVSTKVRADPVRITATRLHLTGPDVLTISRGIVAVAVGAVVLAVGQPLRLVTLSALVLPCLADMADGWWARRAGTASARGARLDTAADAALALAILAALIRLVQLPPTWLVWSMIAICALRVVTAIVTARVSGHWAMAHTIANKAAGVAAAIAACVALGSGKVEEVSAIAACVVAGIAAVDELAYALRTTHWRADAAGWWRA